MKKIILSGLFAGVALLSLFIINKERMAQPAYAICNPAELPVLEITSFSVANVTNPAATSTTFLLTGDAISCNNIHPGPIGWTVILPDGNTVDGQSSSALLTINGTVSITGLSTGFYNATATITDINTNPSSVSKDATFSVTTSATGNGTVVVNSLNSQGGTVPNGTWDITGPNGDICNPASICTGAQQTYTNQATGNYTLTPGGATGYSFGGASLAPVAVHNSFFGKIFAFTKNLLSFQVFAVTTSPCVTNFCSLTIPATGGTITFNINWDPLASMLINPSTLSFTSSSLQQVATVSNNGTTGSTLTWKAASGAAWATLSETQSPGALSAGGAGDPVTVTVNPVGLGTNTTSTLITFTGTSEPTGGMIVETLIVTYDGAGFGGGTKCPGDASCPVCSLTANPQMVKIPEQSKLTYSCSNVSFCSDITGTDGKDVGPVKVSGTSANGSVNASPIENTTYSVTCAGSDGSGDSANASVEVTVINPSIIECGPGQMPVNGTCPD